MNIFEHAKVQETGLRRPHLTQMTAQCSRKKTGKSRREILRREEVTIDQHSLSVTLGLLFWSSYEALPVQEKKAKRALLHQLYGEILHEFSIIESALLGQDAEAGVEAMTRIKKGLGLND